MLEISVLAVVVTLCLLCGFSPLARLRAIFGTSSAAAVANGSANKSGQPNSFLSYLQTEVEKELTPRPTCSILQRHYDSLVAAELQNRIAMMAD